MLGFVVGKRPSWKRNLLQAQTRSVIAPETHPSTPTLTPTTIPTHISIARLNHPRPMRGGERYRTWPLGIYFTVAPIQARSQAGLLVVSLGLCLLSISRPVSGAPIVHRHRHLHRNAAAPDDELYSVGTPSAVVTESVTSVPRAVPDDGPPIVGTSMRLFSYPVETSYISNPLREEEEQEKAPTAVFDKIADRTRPLVRSSGAGGGIPPQPYPPNKSIAYHYSGVSDSVVVFFLAAVGFFFISLIWNLYVRYGWARDKAMDTDLDAVGAMRLRSLFGESTPKAKGRGNAGRCPGGWLRAANEAPISDSAV
ncbi:uncharacterized protein Z519_02691 [Cladophialophora bantiana CBS 173.52]|uniref:Uncharacterized protein n=1 Tax=Cladophialophora bantiana (strain ATCC 10958 / CBS 173.52 / CDC B-1940 / NIH 8579) TaxID=1442370 RepID=A0A0D2IKF2_CLAB1|nr:uncharacterized protein Z519_02691 [Cladophialophora bantiana CBS 173.52]KIW97299.1 hypothetical protein Z519_02691 [Cladophialophora bantiana CBS 173.52]